MTVQELIKKLEQFAPDKQVLVYQEGADVALAIGEVAERGDIIGRVVVIDTRTHRITS